MGEPRGPYKTQTREELRLDRDAWMGECLKHRQMLHEANEEIDSLKKEITLLKREIRKQKTVIKGLKK